MVLAKCTLRPRPAPVLQLSTVFNGKRVKSVINGAETTYFVGAHYEVTGSSVTKYYFAGAQRIAMKKDGALNFLLGDHLGSTSLVVDATGNVVSEMKYKAWGEVRYASGTTPTDYTYTGQYSYANDFGLLFYNARWYDPSLGRFNQPDTIVPGGIQGYDRYAYANNNPVRYTDPTGHDVDCGIGDSYCNEARREYYYSWRQYADSSFKIYLKARDAYEFYYKHPDIALNDMFEDNSEPGYGWDSADSYTLASIYSENVKHQLFNPVSDQFLVWEMDKLNARRNAGESVDPKEWAAVAAALFITFGPDGGSGGGGGGDVKLSGSYLRKLEKRILADGYQSIEDFKIPHGVGAGGYELYVKPNGDIVVKPSSGIGPGESTGYNIYDLP